MKNIHDWLSVSMEEYKAVRAECLTAVGTQQSALNLGAVFLGILIAAAARISLGDSLIEMTIWLQGTIFWIFIPLVSLLATIIWVGEVMRLLVAHCFVLQKEIAINHQTKTLTRSDISVLEYGHWLYEKRKNQDIPGAHWVWKYYAAGVLFPLIAIGCCTVGNYLIIKHNPVCWPFVAIIDLLLIVIWSAFIIRLVRGKKKFDTFMEEYGITKKK